MTKIKAANDCPTARKLPSVCAGKLSGIYQVVANALFKYGPFVAQRAYAKHQRLKRFGYFEARIDGQFYGCPSHPNERELEMPKPRKEKPKSDQVHAFKALAKSLECDTDEATFNKMLGKLGKSGPVAKPKRKARKPLKLAI